MHRLHTLASKTPGFSYFIKPDPINKMWKSVSSRVRHIAKTVRVVGKDAVKIKSVLSPRTVEAMSLFSKFKGKLSLAKFAGFAGGALILGLFAKSFLSGLWSSNQGSAHVPDKYSRGYDTIKESMTDFGSRVYLSKTASKVNVTPRNTTRDALIRSTNSVINSNLSFRLHDNAINHTRY